MCPVTARQRFVLTRQQARQVDRRAVDELAMPSILLMEHAAIALADEALAMLGESAGACVIACGPGNNGGDGLACARILHNAGAAVRLVLSHPLETLRGDAATNATIALRMGLAMTVVDPAATPEALDGLFGGAGLIVDALLGTGLARPVEGLLGSLIDAINRAQAPVLAADLPSGLDCDTGAVLGRAVHAAGTVTFAGLKPAMRTQAAAGFVGRVVVGSIGVPDELIEQLGTAADG